MSFLDIFCPLSILTFFEYFDMVNTIFVVSSLSSSDNNKLVKICWGSIFVEISRSNVRKVTNCQTYTFHISFIGNFVLGNTVLLLNFPSKKSICLVLSGHNAKRRQLSASLITDFFLQLFNYFSHSSNGARVIKFCRNELNFWFHHHWLAVNATFLKHWPHVTGSEV